MMSKGVHARDENSNAYSERSANWQVAVCVGGRRNAVLRVENAAVDLKIRPRTGSKSQAFTSASLMMLLRAHARDGNSNACSDRSANWQVAVRLRGRRNVALRVENAAVDLKIRPRTGSKSQQCRLVGRRQRRIAQRHPPTHPRLAAGEVRTSRRRWWSRPTSRRTPLASTAKSMAVAGRWACCSSTRCPTSRCHRPPTGAAAARVHLLRKHTLTKPSPLARPCRRP
jgi:hypothetical protein